jgi:hypothetical protein
MVRLQLAGQDLGCDALRTSSVRLFCPRKGSEFSILAVLRFAVDMPEFVSGADRLGDGTSRAEPASARRIGDARNLATQMLCVTRAFGEDLGYGNGCDERLRVGVERALEHHARVRELDDLAE